MQDIKKIGIKMQQIIEKIIFISRWGLVPIYLALCLGIFVLIYEAFKEFLHLIPHLDSVNTNEATLFLLHLIDLALIGNLILMVVFVGYEHFVAKLKIIDNSGYHPTWMKKIDFSALKQRLMSAFIVISGVNLLEAFFHIENLVDDMSQQKLLWMVVIHLAFVVSALLLAIMKFLEEKSQS
jgi:uncharacterized protein (TIGR00645 family)